jgi:hypothetical protein
VRTVIADPAANPPVYPWGGAPGHLATRAQLAALGLRPGRRGGRPRADGYRFAYLYDIGQARPRIAMSERRAAALAAALTARQTCSCCGVNRGYVPSRRLGTCNDCVASDAA